MKKTMRVVIVGVIIFFGAVSNVAASAPIVVSAKITSQSEVSIEFSEAVYTKISDYTGFTGALSGRSITGLSGSGTRYITLTFDGAGFSPITAGGFTLGAGTVSERDNTPFVGTYINVIDGQAPTITSLIFSTNSNSFGAGIAKKNDTLTLTFITSESIKTPTIVISGHTVSVSGSGIGPYVATYTYTDSDTAGLVPFIINMEDISGARASPVRATLNFNSTVPEIFSLTSDATSSGILKMGETIRFRLMPKTPDPNLRIFGSYNGVSLNWTTIDRGYNYTAIYTVASGHISRSAPLQITDVVIADAQGNISPAFSGNDIQKIIFALGPAIAQVTPIPYEVFSTSPVYEFSATQAGSIKYFGDCASPTMVALVGKNSIQFNALSRGLHNNCSIIVTDSNGVASNRLDIPAFTIMVGSIEPDKDSTDPGVVLGVKTFVFSRFLNIGATGDDVKELQNRLTQESVYSGPITGKFGVLTFAGVKKFQKAHGISQLGYVGPATRAALNK